MGTFLQFGPISSITGTAAGTAAGTATGLAAGTATGTAAGTATGTAAGTDAGTAAGTAASLAAGTATGTAAGTAGILMFSRPDMFSSTAWPDSSVFVGFLMIGRYLSLPSVQLV